MRQSRLANRSCFYKPLPMSASLTEMPKCMQATRNRRPLGPFIARCDEKGQTNRRAGSFRTRPQASLCGHLRKPAPVKRHAAHSQAGCHRELPSRSPTMVTRLAPSIGAAGISLPYWETTIILQPTSMRARCRGPGFSLVRTSTLPRTCGRVTARERSWYSEVKRHLRRADLRPQADAAADRRSSACSPASIGAG